MFRVSTAVFFLGKIRDFNGRNKRDFVSAVKQKQLGGLFDKLSLIKQSQLIRQWGFRFYTKREVSGKAKY